MRPLALTLALGLAACSHWAEVRTPLPKLLEEFPTPRLRLATVSGELVVMVGARIAGNTVVGLREQQSKGEKVVGAMLGTSFVRLVPTTLAVQDVVRVEARRRSAPATAALVVLGAAAMVGTGVLVLEALKSFRGIADQPLVP